jgi:hypothetical protein
LGIGVGRKERRRKREGGREGGRERLALITALMHKQMCPTCVPNTYISCASESAAGSSFPCPLDLSQESILTGGEVSPMLNVPRNTEM